MPDSYDIPPKEVTDSMSPEEAGLTLRQFDADVDRDKTEHAFLNGNHPQHKDAAAYHRRLLEQANTDTRTIEEKTHEDMYQRTVEKEQANSEKLKQQASAELAILEKLNFDTSKVPDEVMPYHITGWQRQRFLAEGNYAALGESLRKVLDPNAVEIVNNLLSNTRINSESKAKHLELIIADAFENDKANYENNHLPTLSELKVQMDEEADGKFSADAVLVEGRNAAQIAEEIRQLESTPGFLDPGSTGLKYKNRDEFNRLVEERDNLYRAQAAAKKISDDNDASYEKMIKRASGYNSKKRGR